MPGDGVAKLAHEIVENFEAQAQKDLHWEVAFEVSHKAALGPRTRSSPSCRPRTVSRHPAIDGTATR